MNCSGLHVPLHNEQLPEIRTEVEPELESRARVISINIRNKDASRWDVRVYMAALSRERPFWSVITAQTEQALETYWSYIFLI